MSNQFKTCNHTPPDKPPIRDWRECTMCCDEVAMQLAIARSYLTELATAEFNENGDCVKPIAEPVRGRHFTAIAATGYKHCA